MPKPSLVKIDGVEITQVTSVEFGYETPTDENGYFTTALPHYGKITLSRKATDDPLITLFKLATNQKGTKKTFVGEIKLVDTEDKPTYTAVFKNAFIEQWSLTQNAEDAPGNEVVVLRIGELTFHAGIANEKVDFKNYFKKKK